MRIAFDLDQTLIPWDNEFPVEPSVPLPLLAALFKEPLRQGTVGLLRQLQAQGCELWVYTISTRSSAYLRTWFLLFGIRIGGVINGHRHATEARLTPYRFPNCTKYPPAFGIDLLVDDSAAVMEEGRRYGFPVLHIAPEDMDWTRRVLHAVQPGRHR